MMRDETMYSIHYTDDLLGIQLFRIYLLYNSLMLQAVLIVTMLKLLVVNLGTFSSEF
jgi:hypothetical protein